ncbi:MULTISPECIES: winged helix-turn-helix domain-containing protein [Sphingomonas]|jgi:DNA-binding winged helix-turn-helix (wHTH) protein|uniref:winged helix-turn-helix domain-containing protein n=2 Tax=Pseudomonadota TaxID=1224 RepID=UPI001AE7C832
MGEYDMQMAAPLGANPSADDQGHDYDSGAEQNRPLGFGEFVALPASRTLLCRGAPIELGGRAFDLLIVLLRARGSLVTRDEIVRYVWPSTIVDESNLRFQMACLRKALGEARNYIKTVPGRGYLFVGDDDHETGAQHAAAVPAMSVDYGRAHGPAIFVVDRDDVIREALDRLLRSFDVRVTSFASVEALLESSAMIQQNGGHRGGAPGRSLAA